MPSRRHVLALLAATPFAASACDSPPDYAASWRSPGAGEADPRRFALAHAILAPNPHNTQLWLVEFDGEDSMTHYCDLERRLPFTDPLDRQITMGCGAFLELYMLAAISLGFECEFTPFPGGEPTGRLDARPLARIRIKRPPANTTARPVPADRVHLSFAYRFSQIGMRRTNRNDYDASRTPPEHEITRIREAAEAHGDVKVSHAVAAPHVAQLRDLVWRAFDREMHTRGAQEETYQWLRFGKAERARQRDGLYIDVLVPGLLRAIGMLDREDIVNPDSDANKQAAADWRRKAESAPAFMWLATPDDTPTARLRAGMVYATMNLCATAAGLAMHPWSQALQEYEEMADLYTEAKTLLGASAGETVQMLVRVGYADSVEPAARRDVADFARA